MVKEKGRDCGVAKPRPLSQNIWKNCITTKPNPFKRVIELPRELYKSFARTRSGNTMEDRIQDRFNELIDHINENSRNIKKQEYALSEIEIRIHRNVTKTLYDFQEHFIKHNTVPEKEEPVEEKIVNIAWVNEDDFEKEMERRGYYFISKYLAKSKEET